MAMRIDSETKEPRKSDNSHSEDIKQNSIKVAIIDDESLMRRALARLMKSSGMEAVTFSSPHEFLNDGIRDQVDCAVTDLRMPGLDGLGLQRELSRSVPHLSIVFITGHGNVPAGVQAMKNGAVDFLEKPVDSQALLGAVVRAAERSRMMKASYDQSMADRRSYERLTLRERQIFALIVDGSLNKQAAFDLGISEKTVKLHRARVMAKMRASSLAELARTAERLGISAGNDKYQAASLTASSASRVRF